MPEPPRRLNSKRRFSPEEPAAVIANSEMVKCEAQGYYRLSARPNRGCAQRRSARPIFDPIPKPAGCEAKASVCVTTKSLSSSSVPVGNEEVALMRRAVDSLGGKFRLSSLGAGGVSYGFWCSQLGAVRDLPRALSGGRHLPAPNSTIRFRTPV